MTRIDPAVAAHAAAGSQDEKLRRSARDLEGVFVGQLLKAMRDTVPADGLTSGGSGEEMFTTMFDEHIAAAAPAQWHHGIGAALYRQLRAAVTATHPSAADRRGAGSGN